MRLAVWPTCPRPCPNTRGQWCTCAGLGWGLGFPFLRQDKASACGAEKWPPVSLLARVYTVPLVAERKMALLDKGGNLLVMGNESFLCHPSLHSTTHFVSGGCILIHGKNLISLAGDTNSQVALNALLILCRAAGDLWYNCGRNPKSFSSTVRVCSFGLTL